MHDEALIDALMNEHDMDVPDHLLAAPDHPHFKAHRNGVKAMIRFLDKHGYTRPPKRESSGWQPIETAPQDGTRVLTYSPNDTRVRENYVMQDPGWKGRWGRSTNDKLPTHWMPMPIYEIEDGDSV